MAGEGSPDSGANRPPDNGGQPEQVPAPEQQPPSPPPAPPDPPSTQPDRVEPRPADRPGQVDRPQADRGDRPGWSHREPGADRGSDQDRGGSPLAPRDGGDRHGTGKPEGDKPGADKPEGDKPDKDAADRAERQADIERAKAQGGWAPERGRPTFAKPPAEGDKGGKSDGSGDKGDKSDGSKDKGDKPGRVRDLKNRIDRVGGPHKFAGRVMKETVKQIGERGKDIPKDVGRAALLKSVEAGRTAKAKAKDLGRTAVKKSVEGVKNHIRKGIEKIPADGKTYDQRASDDIHKAFKQMRQEYKQNKADKKEFKQGERAAYKELKRDGTRSKRQIRNGKPGPKHPRLHPIRHNRWKRGDGKTIKMMHHRHGIAYQHQLKHGTPHPGDSASRMGPKPKPGFHPELTRHQKRWHPDHPKNK